MATIAHSFNPNNTRPLEFTQIIESSYFRDRVTEFSDSISFNRPIRAHFSELGISLHCGSTDVLDVDPPQEIAELLAQGLEKAGHTWKLKMEPDVISKMRAKSELAKKKRELHESAEKIEDLTQSLRELEPAVELHHQKKAQPVNSSRLVIEREELDNTDAALSMQLQMETERHAALQAQVNAMKQSLNPQLFI